jgi:hypothetical protein
MPGQTSRGEQGGLPFFPFREEKLQLMVEMALLRMAGNRNGERNYNERHQLNGKHEQSYS